MNSEFGILLLLRWSRGVGNGDGGEDAEERFDEGAAEARVHGKREMENGGKQSVEQEKMGDAGSTFLQSKPAKNCGHEEAPIEEDARGAKNALGDGERGGIEKLIGAEPEVGRLFQQERNGGKAEFGPRADGFPSGLLVEHGFGRKLEAHGFVGLDVEERPALALIEVGEALGLRAAVWSDGALQGGGAGLRGEQDATVEDDVIADEPRGDEKESERDGDAGALDAGERERKAKSGDGGDGGKSKGVEAEKEEQPGTEAHSGKVAWFFYKGITHQKIEEGGDEESSEGFRENLRGKEDQGWGAESEGEGGPFGVFIGKERGGLAAEPGGENGGEELQKAHDEERLTAKDDAQGGEKHGIKRSAERGGLADVCHAVAIEDGIAKKNVGGRIAAATENTFREIAGAKDQEKTCREADENGESDDVGGTSEARQQIRSSGSIPGSKIGANWTNADF